MLDESLGQRWYPAICRLRNKKGLQARCLNGRSGLDYVPQDTYRYSVFVPESPFIFWTMISEHKCGTTKGSAHTAANHPHHFCPIISTSLSRRYYVVTSCGLITSFCGRLSIRVERNSAGGFKLDRATRRSLFFLAPHIAHRRSSSKFMNFST